MDTRFVNVLAQDADIKERERQRQVNRKRAELEQLETAQMENYLDPIVAEAKARVAEAKGANALKAAKEQEDFIVNQSNSFKAQLSDDKRAKYETIEADRLTKFKTFSIPKQIQEINNLEVETYKERINHEMDDAVTMSASDAAFSEVGLVKVGQAAQRLGLKMYGDSPGAAEMRDALVQQSTSQATLRAIQVQARADVNVAERLLKNFNAELRPEDKIKAIDVIERSKSELDQGIAQELMDRAVEAHPENPAAQERFVRANSNGSDRIYKSAVSMLNARSSFEERQKRLDADKIMAKAYDEVFKTKTISEQSLKQIPPDKVQTVMNFVAQINKGIDRPDDLTTYERLNKTLLSNRDAFAEIPLSAYRPMLSNDSYKMFERTRQNIINERSKGNVEGSTLADSEIQKIATNFANAKGIGTSGKKALQERAKINTLVRNEFFRLVDSGTAMSRVQMKKALERAINERGIVQKDKPLPWYAKAWNALVSSETFEIEPEQETVIADDLAPENPPELVNRIQQIRRQKGLREYTPEELNVAIEKIKAKAPQLLRGNQ